MNTNKILSLLALSLLLIPFQNCSEGGGTILGNPLSERTDETSLFYDAYDAGSSNKIQAQGGITPLAVTPGLQIYICLARTVFYQYNSGIKQMFDIRLGEVELQSFGTELGSYDLAHGPYKRVQLKLRGDRGLCDDEMSVRVVNANGDFVTRTWFRVNYDNLGQIIDGPGQSLVLEVNSIVDALRNVDSNEAIDQALFNSGLATGW